MSLDNWEIKTIKEVAEIITSPVDKKVHKNEQAVFLCNYLDVYNNRLITKKIDFMKATASETEIVKFKLKKGDVVITKDSEDPRDIAVPAVIAEDIDDLLCGYHLSILRPKEKINSEYLLYAIKQPRIRYDFYRYSNGITRFGLTLDSYKKVNILFPQEREQIHIASILSTWDEAIEKTEKLIELKEKKFKWLLYLLTKSDKGWKEAKLGEVCKVTKGKQLNRNNMNDNGAYYALNGGIEPSGRTDNWNTEAETITISEGGNSCGYVNFNTERFWSGGHCYSLIDLKKTVDKNYLFFFLKIYEPRLMNLRVGSGLPNIQKKDIDSFKIKLPKIPKQKQIAITLSTFQKEIDLLKKLVDNYKTQKRGLMQKLLTGKWQVKV